MWPNDPYKELPLADLSIFISATAMPELRTFETKKEWAHRFGQVRLLRAFSLFRADIHWPLPLVQPEYCTVALLMAQRNQIAIIRDMQMPQSLKLDKAAKS